MQLSQCFASLSVLFRQPAVTPRLRGRVIPAVARVLEDGGGALHRPPQASVAVHLVQLVGLVPVPVLLLGAPLLVLGVQALVGRLGPQAGVAAAESDADLNGRRRRQALGM